MLRLLLRFSLCLLILLSGIGLALSREWGWSEYASPSLYVLYYQIGSPQNQDFVVSADGSSPGVKLVWNEGGIAKLDCSPDGRTLAFLSGSGHLYVVNAAGIAYDSPENQMFTTVNVADDGTIALFDAQTGRLVVDAKTIQLFTSDHLANNLDRVDISTQGQVLWNRNFENIQVVSTATDQVVPYVPHGYSGTWLASGQIIAFSDNVTDEEGIGLYGGQYIMDMTTHMAAKIGDWALSRPFSPDGTKVAGALAINGLNHKAQVVIYDLFTDDHLRLLTHDPDHASQPICFLTFRPELLINAP